MGGNLQPPKSLSQNNSHVCARRRLTPNIRRSSTDACSTEISSLHVPVEKLRKERHSMPSVPSNPSPSHSTTSEGDRELAPQGSDNSLTASPNHSATVGTVSLDPPITRAVLKELDISRLNNDLVLRHHLNFDAGIEFRVETQGTEAEERQGRARQYWRALQIEIAWWLRHFQRRNNSHSSRTLRISSPRPRDSSFPQVATSRLPRLFGAVQDILKHLLPCEEWPIIDAALDVSLLTQQLEHGVCDFVALSNWLGDYLRRFCSPMRDCMVHTMTSEIRMGVENAEPSRITNGLVIIFETLQGMSLVSSSGGLIVYLMSPTTDSVLDGSGH